MIENYHLAESGPAYDIFIVSHIVQILILIWEFYIDGTLISYFLFGLARRTGQLVIEDMRSFALSPISPTYPGYFEQETRHSS